MGTLRGKMDTMGNLSRLLLLFLASGSVAVAQNDYPPADPNAQPQYDPNAQPQYDPNAQPQYDPNAQPPQQQYPQQGYQQQQPQQQYPQQGYQQQPADPYGQPQYEQQPQQTEYAFMGAHPIPYDQGGGYCYQNMARTIIPMRRSISICFVNRADIITSSAIRPISDIRSSSGDITEITHSGERRRRLLLHQLGSSSRLCAGSSYYNYVGGYYVYNGPWDPLYWRYRDRYFGYYGGYYRNNYSGGRYWTVRPPAIYRPSYRVGAPGMRVVVGPGRGVVVGAPPVRAGVVVGAPVRAGVVVGAPPVRAGVVVAPARPYVAPARPYGYGAPPARVVTPPPARYAPPARVVRAAARPSLYAAAARGLGASRPPPLVKHVLF